MSKSNNKGRKFNNKAVDGGQIANKIVHKSFSQVMHESMMPYSEFVIMDRALPRVEDGLKPVQRRVLYSMLEVGVTPDKPYRKSARIVGDCMGKYHPHGDRSIYDTMVRMAQPFNMRETLVDGHGNYGSVDGDSAAAMRYTEARLTKISLELLKDIEKDTVSWSFNFDDTLKEPDVLPGRYPNLLVNGSTGIAVGLATNIPTHNLGEAIDAVVAYIDNNNITTDELLKIMPAPDFSTGGYLLDDSEFKKIYETGRGRVIIRAKIHVENADNGRKNIVITEMPYQVNKSNLLQKIARLKQNDTTGAYAGIYEIVDESDRAGTRAVIRVKKDTNIPALLQVLYRQTELQTNFNVNMVAIAGEKPKLLSLLEIISYYVNYQKDVIYRRTKYDLDVSLKREHILEGLLIAIKNIDKVIAIIKQSKSVNEARKGLQEEFALTEIQAQNILDMRLSRLTNLEVNKLETELDNLKKLIASLRKILSSEKLQYNLVKTEMLEIKEKYATERLSQIISEEEQFSKFGDIEEAEAFLEASGEYEYVVYSAGNTLKRVNAKNYNLSTKELSANPTLYEIPQINLNIQNDKSVYLFTNLGKCHKVKITDIPVAKFKDKGEYIYTFVKNYEKNEKVVAIFDFEDSPIDQEIVFATKQGMVKKSNVIEYLSSTQTIGAIKLKEDDEVIYVSTVAENHQVAMFTNDGYSVAFNLNEVPTQGRMSQGVIGVSLADEDFVVNTQTMHENTAFVLFADNGFAKVIKGTEVPVLKRARKGIKVISTTPKNLKLVSADILDKNINFVANSTEGGLNFVVNKKLALDDRHGKGKNVLEKKTKSNKISEVFRYYAI